MIINNAKIILLMISIILVLMLILYKDIALADEKTKQKLWFKIYVIYMRISIGISIIIAVEGIMTTMRFW